MNPMLRRRAAGSSPASAALAATARSLLALDEDAAVSVSEIACGHSACGGVETVILVMRPGRRTDAFKVPRPMAQVTAEDLAVTLGLVYREG